MRSVTTAVTFTTLFAEDSRTDGMNMDPDAHLVARARHGDELAFGQLVRRHHSSVHRAARAALGSASDAEDVAQEAWLHAFVHLAQFQETASFKTWVHAIVRNRAIDHHRLARRRPWHGTHPASVPAHAELRSEARSPEELVLDAERQDRLTAAIATLPGRLRVLLELWHTGQYSYDEMARIAGVRTSTIKSRVWQARQRVTQALCVAVARRHHEMRACRSPRYGLHVRSNVSDVLLKATLAPDPQQPDL
jgi:RNA polymerase sigma-70 factor (ECF subfamily)